MKTFMAIMYKSSILLAPIMVYNTTIKRTIMSRLYGQGHHGIKTAVDPRLSKTILRRDYPGKFQLFRWKKPISEHDKRRLNLTEHETTHDNIQNTKTGKVEALMTSAQNKSGKNPIKFDKIDPVKVDGSFTPKRVSISGEIELDKNGQPIPDINKGGQYMATLSTPRLIGSDTKHLYDINKDGQSYVDKHENVIENAINKNRKPTVSKKIGFIDHE